MGRVLAIDYGSKRVGIAVTDEEQRIASPLTTVPSHELFLFLRDYLAKHHVDTFVLGEPKGSDGNRTDISDDIDKIEMALKNKFPSIPVILIDERFTSLMARESIREAGAGRQRRMDKSLVDQVSAAIILQTYLERKNKN